MTSPFHIIADLPEDYHPSFLQALDHLLCDHAQSHRTLLVRAHGHLAILDRPDLTVHNSPEWMTRQRRNGVTTKHIFLALYQAADEFKAEDSARFVSAGICACALVAEGKCGWHHPLLAESPDERMAQALHDLARDWIVDLLTPCEILLLTVTNRRCLICVLTCFKLVMLPRANRSPEDRETWRRLQEMVPSHSHSDWQHF